MNFQELQNEHSIPVDSRLAMLRLSSAADTTAEQLSSDQPLQQCHSCGSVKKQPHFSPEISTTTAIAAAVTAETPDLSPEKTTLYGGASTKAKRYSNCRFSSSLEEPFPKRTATLLPPISTTSTGDPSGNNNHQHFQGFIKLPLENNQESNSAATLLKPHLFGNSKFNSYQETTTPSPSPSPAKPPLAPPLYRTFSDPTGSASYTRKSPTPPHCTLSRTASWSPNGSAFNNGESPSTMLKSPTHCALARAASWSPNVQELGGAVNNGESPTAMRLKRMKDGMREMRQWCDLMIQEDAQEETEPEGNKILKDDEAETGGEALCEEAVWVERMGSCLILHFKCPCGKGYQILLCGNNCYYKLTNF